MASIFDATAPASTASQAKITGLNSGYNLATSAIGQGNWSPGMRDKAEVRRCRRGHAAPADRRS
jgi:hypothetical protein